MSVDRVQRSPPIVRRKHSNGRTTVVRCWPNVVIGSFVVDFSRRSYEIPPAVEKLRIKGDSRQKLRLFGRRLPSSSPLRLLLPK